MCVSGFAGDDVKNTGAYGDKMFARVEDKGGGKRLLDRFDVVGINLAEPISFEKQASYQCNYSHHTKMKSGVLRFYLPIDVIRSYAGATGSGISSGDRWLLATDNSSILLITKVSKSAAGFAFTLGEKRANRCEIGKRSKVKFRLLKVARLRDIVKNMTKEYNDGHDVKMLETRYPLSYEAIRRLLKRNGLKLRSISEQLAIMHHGKLPTVNCKLSENKLGLICAMLGDNIGNISGKRYGIGVAAGEDLEFAEAFADIFEKEYGIKPSIYERKTRIGTKVYVVTIQNKNIFRDLRRFAKFGKYRWRLLPETMRRIKNINKLGVGKAVSFFWEAEGCPVKDNKTIDATSVNRKGLKQIQEIMKLLGIKTNITGPNFAASDKGLYTLRVSGEETMKLFRDLVNFATERKRVKLNVLLASYKRTVKIHSLKEYRDAFNLRKGGLTISQISKKLDVPICTLINWFYHSIKPRS